MTQNLKNLLLRSDELQKEKQGLIAAKAGLQQDRAYIIDCATGTDDREALDKLAIIARHEDDLRHKLMMVERELAGLAARLLAEATSVKQSADSALRKCRDAELAKLDKQFTPAYPEPHRAR